MVSTIAGNGVGGFADGVASRSQFNFPRDIAIDGDGNLYITDVHNNRIRKITKQGNYYMPPF
jgi:glucose/arabinose dehydrogenase